ncbi:hypothetical protein [Chryseolinea lacunae]|uniref:RDD domain-containing protein n=1 Tax=Chryseolinea lacunae TaxID=2801331 RepID=A0ABS1KQH0_9BACT|nr:hypothetical protein [Chryseolinea lacunae]MBL0741719.1 hypothetical protein [Chryseolinea lacunae]
MALAVSTLFLFLFILPGITFKQAYLSSAFSRQLKFSGILDEVFWALFPSIIMHFLAYALLVGLERVFSFTFDLKQLLSMALLQETGRQYADIFVSYLYYCTFVMSVSFFAGHASRKIIRGLKFDRKFKLFRFSNEWHYLLSGEFLDFPEVPDHPEQVSFKLVNALVSTGNQQVIYIGELIHFTLSDSGGLENIVLKDAKRRLLQDDLLERNRYYEIPGRYITIPYKTIVNINVRYFYLEEVTDDYSADEKLL